MSELIVDKARARVGSLEREIEKEQAIAATLSGYVEDHERIAFRLRCERDAILAAIEDMT